MNYMKISKYDIANGDGIRVVLWTTGCNHQCKECHNPETWDESQGIPFTELTMNELLTALDMPYIQGLTLSGGDPLYPNNRGTVLSIIKTVKATYPNKDIWLWTGYLWDEVKDLEIMRYVDVLIDGPYIASLKNIRLKYRGSSNQRVIDVQKSLLTNIIVEK